MAFWSKKGKNGQSNGVASYFHPNGYKLDKPSKGLIVETLSRYIGNSEALILWQNTCEKLGCKEDSDELKELIKVLDSIAGSPGCVGLSAKSLSIKAKVYQILK